MSTVDYIDLVDDDDEPVEVNTKKLPKLPATSAFISLGLSVLKMQYGDKYRNTRLLKNNSDDSSWESLWSETNNASVIIQYPLRNLLDLRYRREFRCPKCRTHFCQANNRLSRSNYRFHMGRGHIRVNPQWKQILKNAANQDPSSQLLEVSCLACTNSRNFVGMHVPDYIEHMKIEHPKYSVPTSYLEFFSKCWICNEPTKSIYDNIVHREICSNALTKSCNIKGTSGFNKSFECLKNFSIISLDNTVLSGEVDIFEKKLNDMVSNEQFKSLYKCYAKFKVSENIKSVNSSTVVPIGQFKATPGAPQVPGIFNYSNRHSAPQIPTNIAASQAKQNVGNSPNVSAGNSAALFKLPLPASTSTAAATPSSNINQLIQPTLTSFKTRFLNQTFNSQSDFNIKHYPRVDPNSSDSKLQKNIPLYLPKLVESNDNSLIDNNATNKKKSTNASEVSVLSCELCNGMIKSSYTMYNHMKFHHVGAELVDKHCDFCSKKFYTVEGYQHHVRNGGCPLNVKCILCQKGFSIGYIYQHFYEAHSAEFPSLMQSNLCHMCQDIVPDLTQHLYIWHNINKYDSLQEYVDMRPQEDVFDCPSCSISYLNEDQLRNHMILLDHNYNCNAFKCGYQTVNRHALGMHLRRSHNNQQRIQQHLCQLCHETFLSIDESIAHFNSCHNTRSAVILNEP